MGTDGAEYLRDLLPDMNVRDFSTWMFDPAVKASGVRAKRFIYGSPYRPLPPAANLGGPYEAVPLKSGTKGIVLANQPLDLEALRSFDLIPVNGDAIGYAMSRLKPWPSLR